MASHPIFNVQAVIQSQLPVQEKVNKVQWKETYQLIDVSLPDVVTTPTINKVFKIQVVWKDNNTGKQGCKTIFFGSKDDFIFTQNRAQRLKKIAQLKEKDNPLHGDYWRAHLCLSGPDLKQNFKKMSDYILTKKLSGLSSIPQKKKRLNAFGYKTGQSDAKLQ